VSAVGRQLSVVDLQRAVQACRASDGWLAGAVRQLPPRHQQGFGNTGWQRAGSTDVVVLAAHAGAGASTVAVALADAAAERGEAVRLIDAATPNRSGLIAATDAELGVNGSGWLRGRRRGVDLDRVADPVSSPSELPLPSPLAADSIRVVDAGWDPWWLWQDRAWPSELLETCRAVVVCRPTVGGVRQCERVLDQLDRRLVVAVVGPRSGRWPGAVRASFGERLEAARADGRVVAVPLDRRLAVAGIDSSALPRGVLSAGRRLLDVLAIPVSPKASGFDGTETEK
jgi:hypothetical protein